MNKTIGKKASNNVFQLKVETKDFDINVEVIVVSKKLRWMMAGCCAAAVWVTSDGGIATFVEHLGR